MSYGNAHKHTLEKPNTSYKFRIAAVFSESQHVRNINVQHTVYRIPTSRDTCSHKRIQTLPKTSHGFGTWKFVILSLIAQKTYTLVSWISGKNGTCWTQSVDKAGKGTSWTGDNRFVSKSFSWHAHTHKTIRPLQCSDRNDIILYTPCNLTMS